MKKIYPRTLLEYSHNLWRMCLSRQRFWFKILRPKQGVGIYLIFFLLSALVLTGLGCIEFGAPVGADGGVFKTSDKGETWQQKVLVATAEEKKITINSVNIDLIVMDPQDSNTVYLGTAASGLYVTYDGGESWHRTAFTQGKINAVTIDPQNKCNIYVAMGNKIYKSTDCARSWQEIYVETRSNQIATDIAVDFYNSEVVYAGLSAGEFLKSTDGGSSWSVIKRFEDKVTKILLATHDSRIIYIATQKKGLWKSTDAGVGWVSLNEGLQEFGGAFDFKGLIADLSQRDTFILASAYGLLKTKDGGLTWQPIDLLTPPGTIDILSLAINPQNGNEIYYGTSSTFYKSTNGGERWITKKLPTSRAATFFLVDSKNPNIIYLGTTKFKK